MSDPLFMEERRRSILTELQQFGRVSVKDLSHKLNVSAVTIRQDLRALAEDQLIERTHGGAVLPTQRGYTPELSFEVRLREYAEIKDQIAKHAARYVTSGDSIALDSSSTVFAMLPYLKKLNRLLIVTNSLAVAYEVLDSPQIQVMMPSGQLRRDSVALVGVPNSLPDIHLTASFLSVHGYAEETGFTESSIEEAEMMHAMLTRSVNKYILIDDRKWGKIAPYTIMYPTDATAIITTKQTSSVILKLLKTQGATLDIVE